MKITYTGRQVELAPAQFKKLEAQFAKTGKLLDGKGDCEIHVVLSLQRHLQRAEATVNYFGHELVGLATDPDLFTAIHAAAQKLEKQGSSKSAPSGATAHASRTRSLPKPKASRRRLSPRSRRSPRFTSTTSTTMSAASP